MPDAKDLDENDTSDTDDSDQPINQFEEYMKNMLKEAQQKEILETENAKKPQELSPKAPKMDPEERKEKREAALKEAKLAAKRVRKQNRSSQKLRADGTAEAAAAETTKSKSWNPFRRTKSMDASSTRSSSTREFEQPQIKQSSTNDLEIRKQHTAHLTPAERMTAIDQPAAPAPTRVPRRPRRATTFAMVDTPIERKLTPHKQPGGRRTRAAGMSLESPLARKVTPPLTKAPPPKPSPTAPPKPAAAAPKSSPPKHNASVEVDC